MAEVDMKVSLTESAAGHIKRQLEGRGRGLGIRLGVRTSGCSGMAYVLEFVDEPQPEDKVFQAFGASIYVDPNLTQWSLHGQHTTDRQLEQQR